LAEIKALGDIEHIRLRQGVYIGDNENALHLVWEVLDNSIDELLNNYAKNINLTIDNDIVTITDDGRGIPVEDLLLPNGDIIDSIIGIFTITKTGGKFDDFVYSGSKKGQNGMGLVAVNALSKELQVIVKDRKDSGVVHLYVFIDSKPTEKQILKQKVNWNTYISFNVNMDYFKSNIIPIEPIKNRLYLIGSKYQDVNITLNNEKIPNIDMKEFTKKMIGLGDWELDLEHLNFTENNSLVDIYFAYEDREGSKLTPTVLGDVNTGICSGTYLSNLVTLFYKVVDSIIDDPRLTKSDILNNLRIYCSLSISDPTYDSQEKVRMNKDCSVLINKLYNSLKIKLNTFSLKERFKTIIEQKEKDRAIKKIQKKGKRLSGDNPIKDSLKIPGDILYLVEGDSAGGSLKAIRYRATEGVLSLTGKISNTINMDINQALDSDKMKYLLEAIGVGQDKYRYDKIKILADADPDGTHIGVLTCIAIWKYAPDIINNGKLSIILSPLYGARKKGTPFIPIYKIEDTDKYKELGYDIKRFKGLGEMRAEELNEVIRNYPIEYIVELPKEVNEIEAVTKCLVNTKLKRMICSDSRFGLHRIFNIIDKNNNTQGDTK